MAYDRMTARPPSPMTVKARRYRNFVSGVDFAVTGVTAAARGWARLVVVLIIAATGAVPALAQRRDVPYVPTPSATVDAMLRIANVGPDDFVIDLGSGDGRILVAAARLHGARGFGVDIDPQRVKEGVDNAKAAGVSHQVRFFLRNLFETPVAEATVVTMYLLPRVNLELRPRLLKELRPGTRVVSHDFDMGDWEPDISATVRGTGSRVHFWVVPARVEGRWRVQMRGAQGRQAFDLDIRQKYQEFEGATRGLDRPAQVHDARLHGERISFVLVEDADLSHRVRFEGKVKGSVMEGVARGDGTALRGEQAWRAYRADK